jgi:hypothetical protein
MSRREFVATKLERVHHEQVSEEGCQCQGEGPNEVGERGLRETQRCCSGSARNSRITGKSADFLRNYDKMKTKYLLAKIVLKRHSRQ